MYQGKAKTNAPLDGNPQFVPIVKWYEITQDMEMRMIDLMCEHHVDGMITVYRLYYSKWFPYIEKLFKNDKTENTKEILSLDDVYKLKQKVREGNSNYDMKLNSQAYDEIEQAIMVKWEKLKLLIAQSNMEVPLILKEWRPAAFSGDDW